jgi:hypothetical protein
MITLIGKQKEAAIWNNIVKNINLQKEKGNKRDRENYRIMWC